MFLIILANLLIIHLYLRNYLSHSKLNKKTIYPSIYLIAILKYFLIYHRFGIGIDFLFLSVVFSIMMLIIIVDLIEMKIPDNLVVCIISVTFIYHVTNFMLNGIRPNFIFHISGALLACLIFILILIISRGGIGQGDITLISAVGLILGPYYVLVNIILSFTLGSLISIFLLLTKIKNRKDPIPFGPFIIISFFITKLYGPYILNWYLNLLSM